MHLISRMIVGHAINGILAAGCSIRIVEGTDGEILCPKTTDEKKLARHALGLPNDRARSYRNRFHATHDTGDWAMWVEMVAEGWARRELGKEMDLFMLTHAGAALALTPGETLDAEDFPPVVDA